MGRDCLRREGISKERECLVEEILQSVLLETGLENRHIEREIL